MKKAISILAAMLLFITRAAGMEPHPFYVSYSGEHGLFDTNIIGCCQDGFGRLWVGTSDGIYIYTGNKFTQFTNKGYQLYCSKLTMDISIDGDGCIWIMTSKGVGYYDPFSGLFKSIEVEMLGDRSWDMCTDSKGRVWLAMGKRIWRYDKEDSSLTLIATKTSDVTDICINGETILFSDHDGGIYLFSEGANRLESFKSPIVSDNGPKTGYRKLAFIDSYRILTSTTDGDVITIDLSTKKEEKLLRISDYDKDMKVLCLMVRGTEYWIGTSSGVIIYDSQTGEKDLQLSGYGGRWSLAGQYVTGLFNDRDGNVWATTRNGLRGWMDFHGYYNRYIIDGTNNAPAGTSIKSVEESSDGRIWFGTLDGKCFCFTPETRVFKDYTELMGLPNFAAVNEIVAQGSRLWVSSYGFGLTVFDLKTNKVLARINAPYIQSISVIPGMQFEAYIGGNDGIYHLEDPARPPVHIEGIARNMIPDMTQPVDGKIWFASYGNGFGMIDTKTKSYYEYDVSGNPDKCRSDFINAVKVSDDGTIWVASEEQGICKVTMEGKEIREARYCSVDDGLPANNIRGINISGDDVWLTLPNMICQISRDNLQVCGEFLQDDEVMGCQFTTLAGVKASNGFIYYGTSQGIIELQPERMHDLFDGKSVLINNVTVGGLDNRKTITEVNRSVIASQVIKVRQKDAPILAVSFSTMVYGNPNLVNYTCTLKGPGFENTTTTTEIPVEYLGLRPGKYVFTVSIDGETTNKSTDSKQIIILAPWYRSKLAYAVYIILVIALIMMIMDARQRASRKRFETEAKIDEEQRQKKLLQDKIDFMTNVTHEIRTPVSVISILVDKLLGTEKELTADQTVMKMNVQKISQLCNELLDLRRLQEGNMVINLRPEHALDILKNVSDTFGGILSEKGIKMELNLPEEDIVVNCDRTAADSILTNLLSNAMKYCDSRISVDLYKVGNTVSFSVSSDGKLIPPEESEKIFDTFYQSKAIDSKGTGIGLTFARSLARKQGGNLYLDTSVKDMNSFVLELPAGSSVQENRDEDNATDNINGGEDTTATEALNEAHMLVVEDDDSLRTIIANVLSADYPVLTASDGEEAAGLLERNNIEVVISDIMMPKMNGYELCNLIKSNISYSHISVILLTAAAGTDTQLKTLRCGADSYLEKPFSMNVLRTTIENIRLNRKIRNGQFASFPLSKMEINVSGNTEAEFMDRLHSIVLEHMSDTEMTTTELAEMMRIPRKTLIYKLKINTGLSINEYIRLCRLKKAAELLSENKYKVKEVAYYVGYSSSSYFAKHFTAQFGMTPTEFLMQQKGE